MDTCQKYDDLIISIMTDRETPLAEIVGQMSFVKKYADVSRQSWVFISVNDDLTKILHMHN